MTRLIIILCSLATFCFSSPASAKDPFANTSWKVTVTPDNDAVTAGEKPFDDTFTFKGGKFISEKFKPRGFEAANVDTDTRGVGAAGFTVNARSDKSGTVKWSGTTTGDTISGDLVWTRADGTVVNFTFKGELQT